MAVGCGGGCAGGGGACVATGCGGGNAGAGCEASGSPTQQLGVEEFVNVEAVHRVVQQVLLRGKQFQGCNIQNVLLHYSDAKVLI